MKKRRKGKIDDKWKKIEEMRITKEKNMKKKLKQQETWKKRRERNKKIAI